jgi:cytochrome c553
MPGAIMRFQFDMNSKISIRAVLSCVALFASAALMSRAALAAEPAPQPDLEKGKAIAGAVCAACHMPDGNSMLPDNPILAGQHAAYTKKQLYNFRVKPGATQAERANAIMAGFAAMLSDADIRNVSAFYAAQKPKTAGAQRKELVEQGRAIYISGVPSKGVPSCAGCHGPAAAGIPAEYPRLAGQHAKYTEAQLVAFRGAIRKNSAQMIAIAAKMSDPEIAAVSEYIASLK